MSDKINHFTNDLNTRLTRVEDSLNRARDRVKSAQDRTRDSIRSDIDKMKSSIDANQVKILDAQAMMKARVDAKKTETQTQVDDWKKNREIKKLENRAKDAEDYAGAAVVMAMASIEEAEAATLEAIDARLAAEEVENG